RRREGQCAPRSRHVHASAGPPRHGGESSRWRASASARVDLLRVQALASICQTGQHVLSGDTWIIRQDIVVAPSLRQEINDELHGQARALDDRLTDQYVRVGDNALLPFHGGV